MAQVVIRILMIDDDPDDHLIVEGLLDQNSFIKARFETALTFDEGSLKLRNDEYDIVLLDYLLPDGFGITNVMRIREMRPDVPIVLLTGLNDIDRAEEALSKGAQDYLVKTKIDQDTIVRTIRYAIERQRQALEIQKTISELESIKGFQESILQNHADGIVITDLSGAIKYSNPAAKKLFDRTQDELIDAPIGFKTTSNEISEHELVVNNKSTKIQVKSSEIDWNGEVARLVSIRDISGLQELKEKIVEQSENLEEKQEQLQLSEERFRLAALASNDIIYDWDIEKDTIWRSKASEKLFLKSMEKFSSSSSWFLDKIDEQDRVKIKEDLSRSIANGSTTISFQYCITLDNHNIKFIDDKGFIIRDGKGVAKRIIGTMVDITDRILYQKEIESQNLVLTGTVEEQNMELLDANNELKIKNRELHRLNGELDEFFYATSHDLKTPIVNLEALISLMEDEQKEFSEFQMELMDNMKKSVKRSREIIYRLTELSKAKKEMFSDVKDCEIGEVIENVRDGLNEYILENNARVILEHDPCTIRFTSSGLKSIISNLINNAIKYKANNRKPVIRIFGELEDNEYRLYISDNGLGIDLERFGDDVFGLFKRFHSHTEGSGIGLYTVKRIIENGNATIDVESEVGIGTTFKLIFPVSIAFQSKDSDSQTNDNVELAKNN